MPVQKLLRFLPCVFKRLEGSGCGDDLTKWEQRDTWFMNPRHPTAMFRTPGKVRGDGRQIVQKGYERVPQRTDVGMRQCSQVLDAVAGNVHLADKSTIAALRHPGELVAPKRAFEHGKPARVNRLWTINHKKAHQ